MNSAQPLSLCADSDAAPATRRERRKQEVRGRITEAAISLFSERGCDGVTVEEICELADVARKTFYNYYPSKQHLTQELSEALLFGETANLIDLALEKYQHTADRLAYVFGLVESNLSNYGPLERSLIHQAILDIAADDGRAGVQLRRLNQEFERLLADGLARGDVSRAFSIEFLAEMVVGAMNAVILNWLHDPRYPVAPRIRDLCRYLCSTVVSVAP
ncbi:MAG TPA: TetR/AcrR family transcriptional regulator [Spongiibacteraceae bacterium]|nr:TetR/AcrR family transcriptional regulator [Spongiibacteraceae bacterium]